MSTAASGSGDFQGSILFTQAGEPLSHAGEFDFGQTGLAGAFRMEQLRNYSRCVR